MDQQQIPNPYEYPNSPMPYYTTQPAMPQKPIGFAVAALVLGLISLFGMCCCVNFVTAPLAIVFGIIALVKKHRGTGMSIAGIITAALSLIAVIVFLIACADMMPYAEDILTDYERVIVEQDEIFPEYEETGELPEFLTKYLEEPYASWLEENDITMYDIMDVLLEEYKNGNLNIEGYEDGFYYSYEFQYGGNELAALPPAC